MADKELATSDSTVRYYKNHIEGALCRAMGDRALCSVTADDLTRWLLDERRTTYHRKDGIERQRAPSTIRARYNAAKVYFEWCRVRGYIAISPMLEVPIPRGEKKVRHAFTREEARRLLEFAANAPGILSRRDPALVTLALGCGLRASELAGMNWSDIYEFGGQRAVVVHGKGEKERRMLIGEVAWRLLEAWREVCPPTPDGAVWVSLRRKRMEKRVIWMMFHNLGKYAGVPNCHPHRARHTFAKEFTLAHRDPLGTRDALGHSKMGTTEIYLQSLGVNYHLQQGYSTPDEWL